MDKADGLYHWATYQPSSMTALYYGYDYYQEFTGESPKGDLLIGRVSAGVHMRTPTASTTACSSADRPRL